MTDSETLPISTEDENSSVVVTGSIIISSVGLVLTGIAVGIYLLRQRSKSSEPAGKIIWLTVGIGLLVTVLTWALFYGLTADANLEDTSDSLNRIDLLAEVMEAYFGPQWKYMVFLQLSGVVLLFVMLYFATRNPLTFQFDAAQSRTFTYLLVAVGVVVSALAIVILVSSILQQDTCEKRTENILEDTVDSSTNNVVWYVVGGTLLIVAIVIIWWLISRARSSPVGGK